MAGMSSGVALRRTSFGLLAAARLVPLRAAFWLAVLRRGRVAVLSMGWSRSWIRQRNNRRGGRAAAGKTRIVSCEYPTGGVEVGRPPGPRGEWVKRTARTGLR